MCFILRHAIFLCAFALAAHVRAADEDALRVALERVYHQWRSALLSKDMDAWGKSTAWHRQIITRNLIVSRGLPYPDSIFDIPIQPPEITRLRRLEVQQNGGTAHIVYFGKVDLGLDAESIPDNVIILKFILEKGAWKFDTNRFMNLEGVPEVRSALQNGKAEFLTEPEFEPDGIVPVAPAQCRVPDYISLLQIQSYGYETRAWLDGFDYPPVADDAEQQLIIGGLVRGKNKLKLRIKTTEVPKGEERMLEVNAVLVTGDKARPRVRVFTWEHKSATPPAEIELEVLVSPATMRGV